MYPLLGSNMVISSLFKLSWDGELDPKKPRDSCMKNGMFKDEAGKEVFKAICKESLESFKTIRVIKAPTGKSIEVDISEIDIGEEKSLSIVVHSYQIPLNGQRKGQVFGILISN